MDGRGIFGTGGRDVSNVTWGTDLTESANVADALAELDRAIDTNDDKRLAAWARNYGRAAIEAVQELTNRVEDLEEELDELEEELDEYLDDD
jgi:polyhydroxyalkanoate synthesis regulator phasin